MAEKKPSKKPGRPQESMSGSPMDVGLLERIVKLMVANDLNTVEVRDGERRVTLKRGAMASATPVMMAAQAPATATAAQPSAGGSAASTPIDEEAGYLKISSPMVGTFYAAPAKGAKPFVTVGSVVEEETDVCIVEAMKTFNNVKAECRGTIAKVLIQDGQPVQFGTTLFLVKGG
jgi:acetyl-CoA carboxylase biotin carboxyl carrier protein